MRGRYPKPPGTRQRRNRAPGSRTLSSDGPTIKAPRLPPREAGWSDMTKAFWADLWASPMAPEFVEADVHGLQVLAELVEQFWEDPSTQLAAEIRLQRQNFGLTPLDRRRLQWEIERTETALERGKTRRQPQAKTKARRVDPRKVLRIVR